MIILDISSVDRNPRSMPEAGADITVTFRFLTNVSGTFTTRYAIGSGAPYRFANANGPDGSVRVGPRQAPGVNGFSDVLQVRAAGNTSNQANVIIDMQVQETGGIAQPANVVVFVLHQAVAALRTVSGMSQAELADKVGVSRSTISRLEQGLPPSDETREAVEDALEEASSDASS